MSEDLNPMLDDLLTQVLHEELDHILPRGRLQLTFSFYTTLRTGHPDELPVNAHILVRRNTSGRIELLFHCFEVIPSHVSAIEQILKDHTHSQEALFGSIPELLAHYKEAINAAVIHAYSLAY